MCMTQRVKLEQAQSFVSNIEESKIMDILPSGAMTCRAGAVRTPVEKILE